jgi:hypothetical protein
VKRKLEEIWELFVMVGLSAGLILAALMCTPFFWLGIIACILIIKL